jgi:hypothetical protein
VKHIKPRKHRTQSPTNQRRASSSAEGTAEGAGVRQPAAGFRQAAGKPAGALLCLIVNLLDLRHKFTILIDRMSAVYGWLLKAGCRHNAASDMPVGMPI